MTASTKNIMEKHSFANKLYKAISEEHAKDDLPVNLIFSPLSLEIVLSAAGTGARGVTQQQISNALGFPLELETMGRRYSPILLYMKNDSCILRVATHMFVQRNYELRQNFVNGSVEVFTCGVGEVDFIAEPSLALTTINGWAEEKTEGLIKDLLTIDAITPDTRLVLANAVYFKGKWAHPFDKTMTRKGKFRTITGEQVDVDMMYVGEHFRHGYIQDLQAQVLELPYEGEKLSMVVLLPFVDSSLQELENKVSAPDFDLHGLLANHTYSQHVDVHLPKFKLELTTDLENVLTKLGMGVMFTDAADFTGITTSPEGLKVSKVVQKAFIEVSEEGTEAAASSGMLFMTKCLRRVKSLVANRPFVVILLDQATKTIIFSGQVAHPNMK